MIVSLRRITPVPFSELPEGTYNATATGRLVDIKLGDLRYQGVLDTMLTANNAPCKVIVIGTSLFVELD